MSTTNDTGIAQVPAQQVIDLLLINWESKVNAITDYFNQQDNAFYQQPIAAGRNRAIYVLGHLAGSNDGLNVILGFGNRQFPDYEKIFQTSPDGTFENLPDFDEIKRNWISINDKLYTDFKKLSPAQWFERHLSVSEEDFKKEPNRNKLNVLIGRITHLAYHLGQLKLLKKAV